MKHQLLLLLTLFIASFGHIFTSKIDFAKIYRSLGFENYRRNGRTKATLNLNEMVFKEAVESADVIRVRQLIVEKKHLLLNSYYEKPRIFKYTLKACIDAKDSSAAFGEIFGILLENHFYPEDGEFPWIGNFRNERCPLMSVLHDPLLYQLFLDYDKDFFAKVKNRNYVSKCIALRNYSLARTALNLGFDPNIDNTGRNALDYAHDIPRDPPLTAEEEAERQDLVRILVKEYKMESTRTQLNMSHIGRSKLENWEERAIELVSLGGMKWDHLSPIGEAFCDRSGKLVNAAIDMYIDEVSMKQLEKDLVYYLPYLVPDPHEKQLLAEAVERIKILKNVDSIKVKNLIL